MKQLDPRIIAAIEAVIAQGRPSVNEKGRCLYRGPDGLKCLIGHMITDDEVKEATDVTRLYVHSIEGFDKEFLLELQGAHDYASRNELFVEDFTQCCHFVLSNHGYEIPECLK